MGLAFGIGILIMIFVLGFMFVVVSRGSDDFTSGERVHPSPDRYIVFINEADLSGQRPSTVRCTATTDSGEHLTLSPPAEPLTVSVGKYRKQSYSSVAQLPTDRGPLTVNCTGVEYARYLLMTSGSGPSVWVFFAGYGALLAILVVVAWLTNRRYYRRMAARVATPPQ
ncbi:hypothetical protein [Mycolicibacterium setense]